MKLIPLLFLTLLGSTPLAFADDFKPPLRGAPDVRIGGGSRAVSMQLAKITLLAPKEGGKTASASPDLYWRLSKNLNVPVEIKLTAAGADTPALNISLSGMAAGLHKLNLSEYGVKLQPGISYTWQTAIVWDVAQRSKDSLTSASLQHTPAAGELRKQIGKLAPRQLLEQGYGYDAISTISAQIDANPDNPTLREERAALLEQLGQPDAARAERSGK